jgi:hypothetical protein
MTAVSQTKKSHVLENGYPSQQAQASHQAEGFAPVEPAVTAGTSQHGQICTMLQRKAELVAQQDFFGGQGMHYMA